MVCHRRLVCTDAYRRLCAGSICGLNVLLGLWVFGIQAGKKNTLNAHKVGRESGRFEKHRKTLQQTEEH